MVKRKSVELMFTCLLFVLAMSIFFSGRLCNGSDTLTTDQPLFPNQTIVSKQGKFELAFFNPGTSTNYYVGIRYQNMKKAAVWVGNRDSPIPSFSDNNSRLEMSNGSLNLIANSKTIWTLAGSSNASEAVILDTGNLVLRNASGVVTWQSFDHPTGTWLTGGVIGFRRSSNIEAKLISWRSGDDPGTGNYSLGIEPNGGGELFIKKNDSEEVWRSGVWRGETFASLPYGSDLYNFSYVSTDDDEYLRYNVVNETVVVRIVMHTRGQVIHYVWSDAKEDWVVVRLQPSDTDFCSRDAKCGPNAICDANYSPACRCLSGFLPQAMHDWDLFDFSLGCVRGRPLQCDKDRTGFTKVNNTTLPANPVRRNGECEPLCKDDCSCNAYAYGSEGECLLFTGALVGSDRLLNNSSGNDLYVKWESVGNGKKNVLTVALVVPTAAAILVLCFCYFYRWQKLRSRASQHRNLLLLDLNSNEPAYNGEDRNNQNGLPIFSFFSIVASTNNFSNENKLGEGGFGPVYKGELLNGQFVAVKRLSGESGQGLEEFRNETELISKLQHRNLVGILGCCIENNEKILVYEYMPNKSLDFYLFEPTRKHILDWKKRVHIIEGIAQGLLYLHHYSRLRIVHRDLKASNILLDAELNPKISDFGMARIFGGNDSQANTKRIVGTYGYMPPEYAIGGLFSVKSDVFAFGVLMLEIISGKRNTGFYSSDYLTLLGYALKMWKHGLWLEFIDPILDIPVSSSSTLLRNIQTGLLCVEENPADRPLMSDVIAMLNNEETTIASPKHPAFTVGRTLAKASTEEAKVQLCSVNDLTISDMEAR